MCWLCKIIGHKWTMKRHRSMDSVRLDELVIFGCCLRCGEDAPETLMLAGEELKDQEKGKVTDGKA